jgi:erythromycin esterase
MRRADAILVAVAVATLGLSLVIAQEQETDAGSESGESPVEGLNLGFEAGDRPEGWFAGGDGYVAAVDSSEKHSGKRSLRIAYEKPGNFGVATGRFPVDDVRGKRLRLTGYVKSEGIQTGWAGLWMRVDGPSGVLGFDNMQRRGITGTTDWTRYEIVLEVPEQATNINFGALLTGNGTAWIDSLDLEILPPAEPPPTVTVTGVVHDAEGRPVAGAHVALVRPMADRAASRARSGKDGRFSIDVPSGEYAMTVTAPGLEAAYLKPAPFTPDGVEELVVKLGDGGFTISGTVADDAGAPLPGEAIRLIRLSDDVADIFYTETDENGRYAATLMPGNGYVILTDSDDYIADPQNAESGVDQTVDLTVVRRGPAPAEVVAWIGKHAVPLRTPEAGHGFEDMAPLREVIGDARVVALGEATHGTREFFQLKHRMLEFLVEEVGFTVFAIEANWPESLAIDDYVLHGRGTPEDGLDGIYFWTWNTEEVLALIEWMRSYNDDPAHERKLRFYGFDMQTSTVATEKVIAYLKEVDPDYAAGVGTTLETLGTERAREAYGSLSEEERASVMAAIDAMLERFDARREDYVARSSEREWVLGRQHGVIVKQAAAVYAPEASSMGPGGFNARDESMARNIEWILATEPPGTKVVVWAHNGHVSKYSGSGMVPMGSHLARVFGDRYVVFGFAFNRGSFQAIDWTKGRGNPGILAEHTVGPAPEGNVGAAFARTDLKVFALDLRGGTAGSPVPAWFDTPHPMRQIGAVFSGESRMSQPIVLPEHFDCMLFVDDTTRAIPVKRTEPTESSSAE